MRTTLHLDDTLIRRAEVRAAERGITLSALIEHALAAALGDAPRAGGRYRLRWTTHAGRTLPGVDVADRDSLYDAMERRST